MLGLYELWGEGRICCNFKNTTKLSFLQDHLFRQTRSPIFLFTYIKKVIFHSSVILSLLITAQNIVSFNVLWPHVFKEDRHTLQNSVCWWSFYRNPHVYHWPGSWKRKWTCMWMFVRCRSADTHWRRAASAGMNSTVQTDRCTVCKCIWGGPKQEGIYLAKKVVSHYFCNVKSKHTH